ncbi:MAG: alanine--tRNA ligase-related protein, partial [Leptonema sp. (in: bacteria)]
MFSSQEIRQKFLTFFKRLNHTIVSSSSLIPDDPSVLLTTAGMQQFKKYFTREKDPIKDFGTQRTASIQKCFRTTDIEEIGDERHLTFFEMLGNFSFGPIGNDNPQDYGISGYFKKSAIYWAYEFLKSLDLDIDCVSVFKGEDNIPFDRESFNIW